MTTEQDRNRPSRLVPHVLAALVLGVTLGAMLLVGRLSYAVADAVLRLESDHAQALSLVLVALVVTMSTLLAIVPASLRRDSSRLVGVWGGAAAIMVLVLAGIASAVIALALFPLGGADTQAQETAKFVRGWLPPSAFGVMALAALSGLFGSFLPRSSPKFAWLGLLFLVPGAILGFLLWSYVGR